MNTKTLIAACSLAFLSAPTLAQNPYLQPDDTWIQLSGEVTAVSADSFLLNYGDGVITVEMDDGDRDADGYKLMEGDKVSVSGTVDDEFYENTTIEAGTVYVENIGSYFYASPYDVDNTIFRVSLPLTVSETTFQGTVTSIDLLNEEFTLDTGASELTVEVDEMAYNPLDNEGYQQVKVNDVVSVTGMIDNDLFEGRVFEADFVTSLQARK